MDNPGGGEEKFSNHPCHRLSVPAAKRFWCRHCFEMFDDPISRWRHSKACKNTGLSNMTRRKEQEATALEAFCESTLQTRSDDSKQVILPNLNPRSTNKSYIGPKDSSAVDLSCFICKKQFTTMEEMKDHVRVPCNKSITMSDEMFPFSTSRSTPKPSTSDIIYHGESNAGASGTVYEFEADGSLSKKRTPSPLDPSNLSSETMAAVEALNMMARSDKVNLTQFLNQLSEGGFVIEQAAGSSSANDDQDREIVFTVQGDVGESRGLLQQGGDITVEVAEDLIRMAQRVRVEAVERVVEEQVQEEVVQEDLEQAEVQYIQADQAAAFLQGHTHVVHDQTQYVEQPQTQYIEQHYIEQPQAEQTQIVQVEPVHQQTEYVQEQQEGEPTYTIVNVQSGKEVEEHIVTEGHLSSIQLGQMREAAQVVVVPVNENVVEPENLPSIPDGKRKLEEVTEDEGLVQVKVENGSQVKKLCTEVVTEAIISDSVVVKQEVFEAKKKLQFFNEGLIVQEKCNKNPETTEKKFENELEPCDDVKNLSEKVEITNQPEPEQATDSVDSRIFLDEVDGCFKPMTEDMIKSEENIIDMSILMTVESTSPEPKMTVVKPKPCLVKHSPPSPKKLRSSSRKLVLTPKKKRMLEEKEKQKKKKIHQTPIMKKEPKVSEIKKEDPEPVVKTEPIIKEIKEEPKEDPKPAPKPNKVQPPKQLKCRACERMFNSLKSLQKHKSVPCVVKITRNLCQKILRPKRALPKPPVKKVVKKKVSKPDKDLKKPKLLPVGFRIQAQWIPCKRERKPSKGRGRPRKNCIHYERKKRIILPNKSIEISSLSDKEQFFFELGLVCSEYVSKELRRPLPEPSEKVMTSLTVSVDHDASDTAPTSDISPPLLEKIEPAEVNASMPDDPPNLLEENDIGPPLLQPALREFKEELECSENDVEGVPETDRHFLDSFPEESSEKKSSLSEVIETDRVKSDNPSISSEVVPVPKEVDKKPERSKQADLLQQLKSTLKNVCSPQKLKASPQHQSLDTSDVINMSPKRNLFDTLQTICATKTVPTITYANSPNVSVSSLCKSAANLREKLAPLKSVCSPKKCSSAQSSPKKGPNILRRSVSESTSDQTDSILDIVAKSMGISVESAQLESPSLQIPSARLCEKVEKPVENVLGCKKNLFENCETILKKNISKPVSAEVVAKVRSKVLSKSKHIDNDKMKNCKNSGKDIKPLVSLSSSNSGQILVSPIKTEHRVGQTKGGHSHRGVKRKLCDASTQCERVANSPVKVMLGQLEHRLKLLKSALKTQSNLQAESESSCPVKLKEQKAILPELVSVIMNRSADESKDTSDKNLPDVVRSVTESKIHSDSQEALTVDQNLSKLSAGSLEVSETSSDFSDQVEKDSNESPEKVKVQYINQLEPNGSNGITYLLIQQEGMEDYLTSCDLDLDSGETIHAVTVEEKEVRTFNSKSVQRAVDREVFVNSSGF